MNSSNIYKEHEYNLNTGETAEFESDDVLYFKNKIKVVAITGRSGSGKSTVAKIFTAQNFTVLDADAAAKRALQKGSECIAKLAIAFGNDIVLENGEIDKKLLAQRAFQTSEGAKTLTDITHPKIVSILASDIKNAWKKGEKLIFVDGAVIIGGLFEKYCDEFIVVTAPDAEAVKRITARDGITKQLANKRLSAQKTLAEMMEKANYIIKNNADSASLEKAALSVLGEIVDGGK